MTASPALTLYGVAQSSSFRALWALEAGLIPSASRVQA